MTSYYPVTIDNRGDSTKPFGFVYLSKYGPNDNRHFDGIGRIRFVTMRDSPFRLGIYTTIEVRYLNQITVDRVVAAIEERFPHLKEQHAPSEQT